MTTRVRAALGASALLIAGGLLAARQAADPVPAKDTAGPRFVPGQDVGVSCGGCHTAPSSAAQAPDRRSTEFVLLREYAYWEQHDLHRRAYDALTSKLGREMSQRLYGDTQAATRTVACLVCHATDTRPDKKTLAEKTAQDFGCGSAGEDGGCRLGVNCQACHGPASGWLAEHFKLEWRQKTPAEKAALGLVNLRDPATRAGRCVGCHVGSTAGSQFVTHEMYAAGHPPLPPFELATFSRDEPRHWRPAAAVGPIVELAARDADRAKALFGYRQGEIDSARLVAVGAVVALRESVLLLAFEPDPARPAGLLDFAHFNCAACHHDLRVPSPRQENGFPGVPGRPVPHTWPVWTVRAVLRHAAASNAPGATDARADFEKRYAEFRAAFDATPFGDKSVVREKADALTTACQTVLAVIDRVDYGERGAAGLLTALAEEAVEATGGGGSQPAANRRRDFFDADGATQLARAAAVIAAELADPPKPAGAPPPVPTTPPSFAATPPDPRPVAGPLRALHAAVGLTLRDAYQNGLGPDGRPVAGGDQFLIQSDDILGRRLRRTADYSPAAVRDPFADLLRHLGQTR